MSLEAAADWLSFKRLALWLIVACIMGLAALPVLCVFFAEMLHEEMGIPRAWWLLIFAAGLVIAAALIGWLSWRRFSRRFVGLEQTLEELREDALWLQEWFGREDGKAAQALADKQPVARDGR